MKTPSYTSLRQRLNRATVAAIRRYGNRVAVADGQLMLFIPYGALPETLLAEEHEVRLWGKIDKSHWSFDAILGMAQDVSAVYPTNVLHRLSGPKNLFHLFVDGAGAPALSVNADDLALVTNDVEDDCLSYGQSTNSPGMLVVRRDGEIVAVMMSIADSIHSTCYLRQTDKRPAIKEPLT